MSETIEFAVYLTGHDRETIEQMYSDWKASPKYDRQELFNYCTCEIPSTDMNGWCFKCQKFVTKTEEV